MEKNENIKKIKLDLNKIFEREVSSYFMKANAIKVSIPTLLEQQEYFIEQAWKYAKKAFPNINLSGSRYNPEKREIELNAIDED